MIRDLIKDDIQSNNNFQSVFPGTICMKDITQHALNSGKRLRSIIIWCMAEKYHCSAAAEHFALFIEYVHNASLIVDDLPCMDNDFDRRGVPTVHAKYGEHVAQLSAYNLMITAMKHLNDGFRLLRSTRSDQSADDQDEFNQIFDMINDEITVGLGYQGICGGQLLDLLICKDKDLQTRSKREQRELILKTIRLKTGCLFGVSFALGWLCKDRFPIKYLSQIKEAGYGFGTCYQIIDDLRDVDKDTEKNGGYNNICKYFTLNEIIDLFSDRMETFSTVITQYDLWNDTLHELYNYMLQSFRKEIKDIKSRNGRS